MRLRSSPASPFGRKVSMALRRLGLADRVSVETADTQDPDDSLRRENPLGKIPVLIDDRGRSLFDSRVILEFLDAEAGGGVLIPRDWPDRGEALVRQAVADGMMDAALLVVYEGRFRPEALRHGPAVEHQQGKIRRALAHFAADLPDPHRFTVDTLALASALGYLDLRKPVEWREDYPALVAWLEAFADAHPEFAATAA